MNDLLTIPEAAARLRCSPRQVRRLIDGGQLPAVVIGPRTRRIRPETLDRFIEGAECRTAVQPIRDTRNGRGSQRFTAPADALDAILGLTKSREAAERGGRRSRATAGGHRRREGHK